MRVEYIAAKARQVMLLNTMTDMHIVSRFNKIFPQAISGRIVNGNGTGRCAVDVV